MGASPEDARQFAEAFRSLLEWVHSPQAHGGRGTEVTRLLRDHLGPDATSYSVVSRQLPPFEHVNLQTALDAWMAERDVAVHGISVPPHFGSVGMQQLLSGEGLPPIHLSAPPLVDLPNGPGTSLGCMLRAVLLVRDGRGEYALLVTGPAEHEQTLRVEIAGLPVEGAQAVLADLDARRDRLNVYRGRMLQVGIGEMGGITLEFVPPPNLAREDLILPETVRARIEGHALGIAAHRESLRAAGQHLTRGLLLYGPPGTGKTHTTRYLLGRLDGYTRLVLTGRALHAVGSIAELARGLQPAAVVLEDVDLVAEDRSFGPGSSPVLFDLLDAMDGAAADADLLFVLTTNRADLLEPALAARPGRVDVAVAIGLPDADARRRLFDLYSTGVPMRLTEADLREITAGTEGVTASFLKELIRRAVLESLRDASPLQYVSAEHVMAALDDLQDTEQSVTRSLLGVDGGRRSDDGDGDGAAGVRAGPALGPRPAAMPVGWTSYGPLGPRPRRPFRHGG